ncbi:FAD-binding protein [Dactylosporangium sp. NPDC050588]|uniref:FAD-binding oxidoreductase n=1 Tax=Dactylosporangium sp. NPDC050588 TaxID=3157211 RepID=UPI0033D5AF54
MLPGLRSRRVDAGRVAGSWRIGTPARSSTDRASRRASGCCDDTARVGAGATWGAVQAAAGPRGLTGLAGSSPVVGVTGYTLGGGRSRFGRAFGWAADSVTAFDVVDAAGVPAKATADSDAELFWALRGGGGDVAAVEFRLHPRPGCTAAGCSGRRTGRRGSYPVA